VEQDNGAYNLASAIRFDAPLNEDTLGDTIGEIVRRHEILRTTFPIEDAGPIQSIAASSSIRAEIVDLTGLNEEAAEAVARELAIDQARRPFDLAQGPLVHVKAIRTAPAKHVLTLSFHHVVIDGWCSHLFQRVVRVSLLRYPSSTFSMGTSRFGNGRVCEARSWRNLFRTGRISYPVFPDWNFRPIVPGPRITVTAAHGSPEFCPHN
jgi:hypothetical protein